MIQLELLLFLLFSSFRSLGSLSALKLFFLSLSDGFLLLLDFVFESFLCNRQYAGNNRVQAILDPLSLGIFPLLSAARYRVEVRLWNRNSQYAV